MRVLPRVLLCAHRWLGTAGGVLFVLWFVSGVVMMYARMPRLESGERLSRLAPLDLQAARSTPAQAAEGAGLVPERLRIGMLGGRPVYRFAQGSRWQAVFADDGQPLRALSAGDALQLARGFGPECAATSEHDAYLTEADQWTLQSRALLPLHRIACGDAGGTRLYVSERTGEVVMKTTRSGRTWGYLGAVTHWLYFTPFRSRSALWRETLTWISLAGCLVAASGLLVGLSRYSPARRHRPRGRPSRSPYTGLLRWHHYAGLVFGLATFGWILSGCLSLDPWDWHSDTAPTQRQREAVAGGPLRLDRLEVDRLRDAVRALAPSFAPKELEVVQFRGEPFLIAYRAPAEARHRQAPSGEPADFLSPVLPFEHRVLSALAPERPLGAGFAEAALLSAAREAMPEDPIASVAWLDRYDPYYYDRAGELPLPILRVRYDDPAGTWLYLDPRRGLLLHREERSSRANRWLYRGLHRLDFPWLYDRRPLWDIVVITLLLGGIVLSSSTLVPAGKRLARRAGAMARSVATLRSPRGR